MKFDFRVVEKEAIQDKIKTVTLDLENKNAFDQMLKDLREKNYVLEFEKSK